MADQYIVRPAPQGDGDEPEGEDVVPLGLMGVQIGTAYFEDHEWQALGFKSDPGPFASATMSLALIGTPAVYQLPMMLIDVTAAALLIESLTAEFDHQGMGARLIAEIDQVRACARTAGRYNDKT